MGNSPSVTGKPGTAGPEELEAGSSATGSQSTDPSSPQTDQATNNRWTVRLSRSRLCLRNIVRMRARGARVGATFLGDGGLKLCGNGNCGCGGIGTGTIGVADAGHGIGGLRT